MDDRIYWIWAQQTFGPGSIKPMKISSDYKDGIKEFFEGGSKNWCSRRDITDREYQNLISFGKEQAAARLEYARKLGWEVICPNSPKYPSPLRNIPDPPAVLYVMGEIPDFNSTLAIAVVGSRKAGKEALIAAQRIGYGLAAKEACVVSGGAKGIDSAVLTGALCVPDARTVSVLPVSLSSTYVLENVRLRKKIISRGGALISEYFSAERPEFGAFQVRNRLITGLAKGVVIIQAAKKSGSMIYASRAAEQNRDVFVYPGPEDSPLYEGSRELIADGAATVFEAEDILKEYEPPVNRESSELLQRFKALAETESRPGGKKTDPVLRDSGARKKKPALSGKAGTTFSALSDEPLSIEELNRKTGLSAAELLAILTELEIDGLVKSLPGKRYVRQK